MNFRKEIFDSKLEVCGHYEWSLFKSEKEQKERYTKFMLRIPLVHRWPVALLEEMKVEKAYRLNGYGRNALRQFIQEAKSQGAVCALLKVGWNTPPEDPETARIWKTKFYQSEGFIEMNVSEYEPVMLYRSLL